MIVILYNSIWMTWNVLLAIVSVILSVMLIQKKKYRIQLPLAIVWLLFIPNTLYIITDLSHLSEQWVMVDGIEKFIMIFQYIFLISIGIATFVIGLYFFEYAFICFFKKKISESYIVFIMGCMNFVIALGVIIGRVQRTNSWEVFTNPKQVYYDIVQTLSSPLLLIVIFLFGVIGNILYFSLRAIYEKPLRSFKKFLSVV